MILNYSFIPYKRLALTSHLDKFSIIKLLDEMTYPNNKDNWHKYTLGEMCLYEKVETKYEYSIICTYPDRHVNRFDFANIDFYFNEDHSTTNIYIHYGISLNFLFRYGILFFISIIAFIFFNFVIYQYFNYKTLSILLFAVFTYLDLMPTFNKIQKESQLFLQVLLKAEEI